MGAAIEGGPVPLPSRSGRAPSDVVVIGASLSGLFAAAAAAEAGCSVTILERDALPSTAEPRRGVPQSRQVHALLHRGLLAAQQLVPGLEQAMLDAGAVRINTGKMPWFGPYGWQPTSIPSYDVLSLTRPLLEHLVRERVLRRPNVQVLQNVRVSGLRRHGSRWGLVGVPAPELSADLVVDASGRGSRMPHWLAELGCRVAEPEVVDASLGYACQLYGRTDGTTLPTGLVVQPTPDSPRGGLGLPVEHGGWLVAVSGYGDDRPGRDRDLRAFARTLREPVLAEVLAGLEPVGEVALHRQTGNRRHRYGGSPDWPEGLLVVGDALCAFNPIYGQGITVGACQASVLGQALSRRTWGGTRSLQRRVEAVADFPWAVATGEDRNYLSPPEPVPLARRLMDAWIGQVGLLLMDGNRRAVATFGRVYHLMASPLELFHPALVVAVARRQLRSRPPAEPVRPPVLRELVRVPTA
jgi:2-polyprenyl-6-methoxyphenol hydroxylase-like FAD-dependent oxidoreductase